MEKTFTIIKPDSLEKKNTGKIISMILDNGFDILGMRQLRLSETVAKNFYIEHAEKPFYKSLVAYMTSGPVVVAVLEKANAIKDLRELMGATNPAEAPDGTVRKLYGESIERNAIHGSANESDADREVSFFFSESEIL